MPWKECSAVSCREEFVRLAQVEWAKMSELCRRFGVSRKTGYKWLGRYASTGASGLLDRSRRPRGSPARTSEAMEERVVGGSDSASRLGRAQDSTGSSQRRASRRSVSQHDYGHPASARSDR